MPDMIRIRPGNQNLSWALLQFSQMLLYAICVGPELGRIVPCPGTTVWPASRAYYGPAIQPAVPFYVDNATRLNGQARSS